MLFTPFMYGATGSGDDTLSFRAMLSAMPPGARCSLMGMTFTVGSELTIDKRMAFAFDGGSILATNQYEPVFRVCADGVLFDDVDMAGNYTRIDLRQYDIDNSVPEFYGGPSYLRSAGIFAHDADDLIVRVRRMDNFLVGVELRGETSAATDHSRNNHVTGRFTNCDFGVHGGQQHGLEVDISGGDTTKLTALEPHLLYLTDEGGGTNPWLSAKVRSQDNQHGYAVKLKACPDAAIEVDSDDACGGLAMTDCPRASVRRFHATDVHVTAAPARCLSIQSGCSDVTVDNPVIHLRDGETLVSAIYVGQATDTIINRPVIRDTRTDTTGVPPIKIEDGAHRTRVISPVWRSMATHDEPFAEIRDSDDCHIELPELWGSDRVAILVGTSDRCSALLYDRLLHSGLEPTNGFRTNTATGTENGASWV